MSERNSSEVIKGLHGFEGSLSTDMGKWFPGRKVVLRGKDLLHDLRDMRWMELLLFGITGRNFSAEQIRLFEGIWSLSVSYPDPRIWPNRIAALAGTARSTAALGVSSALAISEGELFGHRSNIRTIDYLIRLGAELKAVNALDWLDGLALEKREPADGEGAEHYRLVGVESKTGEGRGRISEFAEFKVLEGLVLKELKTNRWIPGFGRPIARTDERIVPLTDFAYGLGFGDGIHLKLAYAIEEVLRGSRYRAMRMNIGALDAALSADQGLESREYYWYFMLSFSAGMVPCFIDAERKDEGGFYPLRCDSLIYEGEEDRTWEGA